MQNEPNWEASFKFEGCRGRPPCLPIRRAATGGRPYTAEGRLRGIPHYSSILSFHHSAPNKPNFGPAEGRTSAVWIRSCDEWDTGEAVKNKANKAVVGSQ